MNKIYIAANHTEMIGGKEFLAIDVDGEVLSSHFSSGWGFVDDDIKSHKSIYEEIYGANGYEFEEVHNITANELIKKIKIESMPQLSVSRGELLDASTYIYPVILGALGNKYENIRPFIKMDLETRLPVLDEDVTIALELSADGAILANVKLKEKSQDG